MLFETPSPPLLVPGPAATRRRAALRTRGHRLPGLLGLGAIGLGVIGLGVIGLALSGCGDPSSTPENPAFNLRIREDGVYAVTFEALRQAAGGELDPWPSDQVVLSHRGIDRPRWVVDGGDGLFGPGDRLEMLGQHLAGERTYYHEQAILENYHLAFTDRPGLSMVAPPAAAPGLTDAGRQWHALGVGAHLERDRLRLRFAGRSEDKPPTWYWQRLTHLDRPPFRLDLDLRDFDPAPGESLRLRVALQGWSKPRRQPGDPHDHVVEVKLGQETLGTARWNGQTGHVLEVEVAPDAVPAGRSALHLVIPKRRPTPDEPPMIDVVMLDWIELDYPRRTRLLAGQERLRLDRVAGKSPIPLATAPGQSLVVYGLGGARIEGDALPRESDGKVDLHLLLPPEGEETLVAVLDGQLSVPEEIVLDRPSSLRSTEHRADYVVITHPSLRQAIEPLADYHRGRDLEVVVVEVDDIYDEFSHGIALPEAIHDFLAYAYDHWQAPAPRFVLLVGDASWDTRNAEADDALYADWTYRPGEKRRFVKNTSTAYDHPSERQPHRDLVPTLSFETPQGHAASDNGFVAVAGDDHLPEMAIGRFPVTEPEEVAQIVAKTLRYAEEAKVGPWRRNVLWITNEEPSYQRRSEQISEDLARHGFTSTKVYPSSEEENNERHQMSLRQAFDQGQLLVHFYGHGGRYIWRTGPPDLEKNHDLFTLDDLDQLESDPPQLPMVLSMSCYSAPFDHPTADSIGEKFLRLADRGAVAVLAASWRNNPSVRFSQLLLAELTSGGTLGEAVQRAKIEIRSPTMVEMYNLLGDPALELALPSDTLQLAFSGDLLTASWPQSLEGGQALVEWLDAQGQVVDEQQLPANGTKLELALPTAPGIAWVRIYVWDQAKRYDALGAAPLPEPTARATDPVSDT